MPNLFCIFSISIPVNEIIILTIFVSLLLTARCKIVSPYSFGKVYSGLNSAQIFRIAKLPLQATICKVVFLAGSSTSKYINSGYCVSKIFTSQQWFFITAQWRADIPFSSVNLSSARLSRPVKGFSNQNTLSMRPSLQASISYSLAAIFFCQKLSQGFVVNFEVRL